MSIQLLARFLGQAYPVDPQILGSDGFEPRGLRYLTVRSASGILAPYLSNVLMRTAKYAAYMLRTRRRGSPYAE